MPTVLEQLLGLKDYPAKLLIGRATESGILILEHDVTDQDDAIKRVGRYEMANIAHLKYRYEVVSLEEAEGTKEEMREILEQEASVKGLPTGDWK